MLIILCFAYYQLEGQQLLLTVAKYNKGNLPHQNKLQLVKQSPVVSTRRVFADVNSISTKRI